MSSRPDFLARDGFSRSVRNARHKQFEWAGKRNGSALVRNITELDSSKTFEYHELEDQVVLVGDNDGDGNVEIFALKADGTQATIYQQATIAFDSGGTYEIVVGDIVTGATSGATAVITKVVATNGDWAGGLAAGTFTMRFTSPGTDFVAENLDVAGNPNSATVAGVQTLVTFTYLGTDISKIRPTQKEKTVIVLNTDQTVAMLPAPTGTVTKKVNYYIKNLSERENVAVGDIYKTAIDDIGFPAGYYYAYGASGPNNPDVPDTLPLYRRIPKPDQADALYNPATMPHRILQIDEDTYEWQEIDWEPRLSGGDVEGQDVNGNDLIRNPPILKDLKILAFAFWQGRSGLFCDDSSLGLSVKRDYFNYWVDNINQTIPSDRIQDELTSAGSGAFQYAIGVGNALFVQCENQQVQYSARDEILSAGGDNTRYNGQFITIGQFPSSSVVAPVAWGSRVVLMMDANSHIRPFFMDGIDSNYEFQPGPDLTDEIISDFVLFTPARMRIINSTLYVLTTGARAWVAELWGRDRRTGALTASWSYMDFDETIEFMWGFSDNVRLITTYGVDLSLVTLKDHQINAETGFDYDTKLDRVEAVEGVYDLTADATTFTLNTTPTVAGTRLFLDHDLVRIPFDNGSAAIAVGDTVVGGTSGASGVVFRMTLVGGSGWTGAGRGKLYIRRVGTLTFEDGEDIEVAAAKKAEMNGDEQIEGRVGDMLLPISVSVNDVVFKGDWGPFAADAGAVVVEHTLGRTFHFKCELPTLWAGVSTDTILVQSISTFHVETTDYVVRVAQKGDEPDMTYTFTSKVIGEYLHGSSPLDTGFMESLAGAVGKDMTITIESDSAGPVKFSGAEIKYERIRF